ncbi:Cryptochrome/DNA photolyase, FAD-binding domain-like superfamily [Sesbania bispinosa]|nr:Cryptochrome/DNA photolyase, FAD-binding domain-like superfamily [Sesbania bispinosa]
MLLLWIRFQVLFLCAHDSRLPSGSLIIAGSRRTSWRLGFHGSQHSMALVFSICKILGAKFDLEGEHVRASGVELGQNYPRPIIDMDLAREKLIKAIFKMWETEAAAKAGSSEARDVVVVDNSNSVQNLDIPKVVFQGKTPCATISANDQKVPALQDTKNDPPIRKRSKCMAVTGQNQDNSQNHDKDICSTADSSSSKKKCTSKYSFSVPQQCSSTSNLKWSWQEQIDTEQSSRKDGNW